MAALWNALVTAYAVLALVPILPFMLIFAVVYIRSQDRKRAIKLSMDVTTFFLIGCVATLLNGLGTTFGPYLILLFMLIVGGLIGSAQNRANGKIDGTRLVRAVWRLSFLTMSLLYILLGIVELLQKVVEKFA
jgi:hypothetical protein